VSTVHVKNEAAMVNYLLGGIFERTLRSIDLGLRGYALTGNAQMLSPYQNALKEYPVNLKKIDSLLTVQKLDTAVTNFAKVKQQLDSYLAVTATMLNELNKGNREEFLRIMNQDKGFDAWKAFSPFYRSISAYENGVIQTAQSDYEAAMNRNLIFQISLLAIGLAILLLIGTRLKKEAKLRADVFSSLSESSKKYLFHSGDTPSVEDQSSIIREVISHFKQASAFISSITQGNYNIRWTGLNETNRGLNAGTLAGQLHEMKDKLATIRSEEERRNWINQGLAQYSEVVRTQQNELAALCFESVKYFVKYLRAQQGGLFVVTEDDNGHKYLNLTACYAFERKKFMERKIAIGEGLVGQAFLENQTLKMTDIPESYAHITSGLGDARPSSVMIVPLRHNDAVVAVLELASLHVFSDDEVKFVERSGEFLSSALSNAETNARIKKLLDETQLQTESLKSQEEEMRQNMEELSATQEEMMRKEQNYIARIARLEEELKSGVSLTA